MAQAKRRTNGGGGSIRGFLATLISLLTIASIVTGWAKVNDINSLADGYKYFKHVSQKADECYGKADKMKLSCDGAQGGGGSPDAGEGGGVTTPGKASQIMVQLNALPVLQSPLTGVKYKRSEWKHWVGTPCNSRETALKTQGKGVVSNPATCEVTEGTWISPYEVPNGKDEVFTDPGALDIDHVIPLGYAAKHGGQGWTPEVKQSFANDLTQLLVTSAKENRGKSDKGPGEYMPPNGAFACTYSTIWVKTASKYKLSIDPADKAALTKGLQACA